MRDPDAAEDLLQEVFVKAHAGPDSVRDGDQIRGSLYRIARNAIIDHYRRNRGPDPLPEDLAAEEPEAGERAGDHGLRGLAAPG